MAFFWDTTARYSLTPSSFRLSIPLFSCFSSLDNYKYTISINSVSNDLVIDAIKNVDIQYTNGESSKSRTCEHACNGRTELS